MATWYRPLLFASIDLEAAEARGVPVRRLGLIFLLMLALTVTGAAQVVGTLLAGPPEQTDRHVPSGLGWPGSPAGPAGRSVGRSG